MSVLVSLCDLMADAIEEKILLVEGVDISTYSDMTGWYLENINPEQVLHVYQIAVFLGRTDMTDDASLSSFKDKLVSVLVSLRSISSIDSSAITEYTVSKAQSIHVLCVEASLEAIKKENSNDIIAVINVRVDHTV